MNTWNLTNSSYRRWRDNATFLAAIRTEQFVTPIDMQEHASRRAVIAQKDYVCYLALEWKGAKR